MDHQDNRAPSTAPVIKRAGRFVSRTRLVMGLLLIVALAIFVNLANKAVHDNAAAIQQVLGR